MRTLFSGLAVIAFCIGLIGPSNAAGGKKDAATCHKMLVGNMTLFDGGHRTRAYGAAFRRCRNGQ